MAGERGIVLSRETAADLKQMAHRIMETPRTNGVAEGYEPQASFENGSVDSHFRIRTCATSGFGVLFDVVDTDYDPCRDAGLASGASGNLAGHMFCYRNGTQLISDVSAMSGVLVPSGKTVYITASGYRAGSSLSGWLCSDSGAGGLCYYSGDFSGDKEYWGRPIGCVRNDGAGNGYVYQYQAGDIVLGDFPMQSGGSASITPTPHPWMIQTSNVTASGYNYSVLSGSVYPFRNNIYSVAGVASTWSRSSVSLFLNLSGGGNYAGISIVASDNDPYLSGMWPVQIGKVSFSVSGAAVVTQTLHDYYDVRGRLIPVAIPGYVADNQQVLTHGANDVASWVNVKTCASGA